MAPLSLKIIVDEGAVTRTVKFDSAMKVFEALHIVKEKILNAEDGKEYGLFLTSADNEQSGVWLEAHRQLEYYMLRDGDCLLYLNRARNLRIRMLDGSLKTLQVDEAKNIGDLMRVICARIGITNHDEYGLCHEESQESEEPKEKPATGTLTLKRKAQAQTKDKDLMMEHLSKKFKTDDNVEWLDQHKTLREIGVDPKQTLLLKRKLFYSDRNIDSRDPVQLNLLYVQTRNAILEGRHPVTEEQALEFAGIQCQIHFGDFNEENHKPGLIENLSEYLPTQYSSSWGAEKKILKLFRKHQGLSHLDAKHLYTKTARDLPTYGVTFFLVKEKQKGKKKLVPRLLGINSEAILRLDEETKETLQVWPLTHIKSYNAGKNETFMLNFGDYSDKEYCVKTNDAYRIRDILEGYIDIIRRRMAAPWETHAAESGAVAQESVSASQGNMMTLGSNKPNKLVEQTFVGPSQILAYEQGKESPQGTQIMTVQQVVITNKGTTEQHAVSGAVAMRSDMSMQFVKKLNRMNSNAVKVVTLLTDASPNNVTEAQKIVDAMEQDMPAIIQGVRETAEKQTSEEAKKLLLDQLNELMGLVNSLGVASRKQDFNPEAVQDKARRIADLTTQMYFSMDPRTRRRSELVRKSRQSFVQDDAMQECQHRASCAGAGAAAVQAIDDSVILLTEESLPVVSGRDVEQLEASAVDKIGKLNAAIALYLTAHADCKNVDYSSAVTSLNTIKELMPELASEGKALGSARSAEERRALLDEMQALTRAARGACLLAGHEDHDQIQEASNTYADVSGKLVYMVGARSRRLNADRENEIIDLSRDVGDMTTLLLMKATELTAMADEDPRSTQVDDAGVVCADAARDLLVCAQLTAPTIHEPHCQSALTASAEHLASSAHNLASSWKPLVEEPSRVQIGQELNQCNGDLSKALERLKAAYANLDEDVVMQEAELNPTQVLKLRFITSVHATRKAMKKAQDQLDKPIQLQTLSDKEVDRLQSNVSQKMTQVNAAVASLLHAKSDPNNPDYQTAELAMTTIEERMPEVITDINRLSATCISERARQAMLNDVRDWCDAIHAVCERAEADDTQALDEAAKRFAKASRKLSFVFSPHAKSARDRLLMELFSNAHTQAVQLAAQSQAMAEAVGGAGGARLMDTSGAVMDSARALKTQLELTAPSMHDPRCQSALMASTEVLAASAQQLVSETEALQDDETGCRVLEARLHQQRAQIQMQGQMLQRALHGIRETFADSVVVKQEAIETPAQRVQRLKFVTSTSAVKDKMKAAENLLDQPTANEVKLSELQAKQLESKLGQNMVEVNAALAKLIQAKSDQKNPDYNVAAEAIRIISEVMPHIVNDTKTLSSSHDAASRRAMVEDMRRWCAAISEVCDAAAMGDTKEFVDSAQNFVNTSNKLTFVVNPIKKPAKEKQILELTATACDKAKQMVDESEMTSSTVGGVEGARLRVRNDALSDAARAFSTTAQLTASSIDDPRCQSALLSSSNTLAATAEDLVSETGGLQHQKCKELGSTLVQKQRDLDKALRGVRENCGGAVVVEASPKQQKLKFVSSASAARDKVKAAEELLNKPPSDTPAPEAPRVRQLQRQLSGNIAIVNGAVASLLFAKSTTNPKHPDYTTAEESIAIISDVLPDMVNDTLAVSASCPDARSRDNMRRDMRKWCNAVAALCAGVAKDDDNAFNESVLEFANVSDKLSFVFPAKRNSAKEKQILRMSASACDVAREMADETQRVAKTVGGAEAELLQTKSLAVCEFARALQTAAQLTAPSIHESRCQFVMVSSAEVLSASADELVSTASRSKDPGCKVLGEQLGRRRAELERTLGGLKEACKDESGGPSSKEHKLKFTQSVSLAHNKLKAAEETLNTPASAVTLEQHQMETLQGRLSDNLASVNGEVAKLVLAKTDAQNPNYVVGEESMRLVAEVVPNIVEDARALEANTTGAAAKSRQAAGMREWCCALQDVCSAASREDLKTFNEKALTLGKASRVLTYLKTKNPPREQQIVQLSQSASEKAQQMSSEAQKAGSILGGGAGGKLIAMAGDVGVAADSMYTTAQLTAMSTDNPRCQAALLSSVESLSSSAQLLAAETSRLNEPGCSGFNEELQRYKETMDKALDGIRDVCKPKPKTKVKPPVPVRKQSSAGLKGDSAPGSPSEGVRASTELIDDLKGGHGKGHPPLPAKKPSSESIMRRDSKTFIEHLRDYEENDRRHAATIETSKQQVIAKKAEEEKREKRKLQTQLAKCVLDAEESICQAEVELNKTSTTNEDAPSLTSEEIATVERQLEGRIAMAGHAAARLVAANHSDTIDYSVASESTNVLSQLLPEIVKDASTLSRSGDASLRRRLLDEVRALCAATRRLCARANGDRKGLNEAAMAFGDCSARLLYVVSEEIDPAQEKEVIARAKAIGDSASRLTAGGAVLLSGEKVDDNSGKDLLHISANPPHLGKLPLASINSQNYSDLSQGGVKSHNAGVKSQNAGVKSQTAGEKHQNASIIFQNAGEKPQTTGVKSQNAGEKSQNAGVKSQSAGVSGLSDAEWARIYDAGKACAEAAGHLVYTAKLVAPSIHHSECQQSLISTSNDLSTRVSSFQEAYRTLSDPQHNQTIVEMDQEAVQLGKLLNTFKEDLVKGNLVKRKEKIIVEDTALRNLAATIMEDAKRRAESSKLSESHRRSFAAYSNKLAEAIRALDVANHRYKRAPHDMNKRQDLENAVQNLQVTLLQARPSLGDRPQNNIVDLTDFVKDVSSEAERLSDAINKTTVPDGKKTLDEIKQQCHSVNLSAFRLMNAPEHDHPDASSVDDILEVDHFGTNCNTCIRDIEAKIKSLNDKDSKEILLEQVQPLTENCNMLRFATLSALATAQSAAVDSSLEDLLELEKRLDKMLMPAEGAKQVNKLSSPSPSLFASRAKLCAATAACARAGTTSAGGMSSSANDDGVGAALAAYVTEMRAHCDLGDPQERTRLKEHLNKLVGLLKTLTMTTGSRVALWQAVGCREVDELAREIMQEIECPSPKISSNAEIAVKVLNDEDLSRLLMPTDVVAAGDKKQIQEKLQQSSSQLSSLVGTLTSSTARPDSLARSAHAVTDVACTLAANARAAAKDCEDPIQRRRIEEAAQQMCFATYGLLKATELLSQDPKNTGARRRMMDACRGLNNAINRLSRTAGGPRRSSCASHLRSLQSQSQLLTSSTPACALPFAAAADAVATQKQLLDKLKTDEKMTREEFSKTLGFVTTSACSAAQYASHCSYLLCVAEKHKDVVTEGLVDVAKIQMLSGAVQDSCYRVMRMNDVDQIKEEESKLSKQIEDLKAAVKEASNRAKGDVKRELTEASFKIDAAATVLLQALHEDGVKLDKITTSTMTLADSVTALSSAVERPSVTPVTDGASDEAKTLADDVIQNSKILLSKTQALVKQVKTHEDDDDEAMTWVTFDAQRTGVLDAFEKLVISIKNSGQRAGLVAKEEEPEDDTPPKSYVQIQVEVANKWLHRRPSKAEVKAEGEKATLIVIDMAEKVAEDQKGSEREEMTQLIAETKELFEECRKKYDNDNASALMERLRELRVNIERGVVSRVVEDFLSAEAPLEDLELELDVETDEAKRKFILERKIAQLLAQLGRARGTARLVAQAGGGGVAQKEGLENTAKQTELLAPLLVKAAQERLANPNDESVVSNYKKLLAQYSESFTKMRDLCDQAVDPMDFVQTAGETISKLKEDTNKSNDVQTCAYTSTVITRLANRVISVGLSSPNARSDPSLRRALSAAQQRLAAAVPKPDTRQSKLPDWRDTADVILRTTGEVESVLGGEHIFGKQPEPDQPIYNAALNLHAVVREWSGRDNEIVATAKRMAVLMARLSDFMNTDKKRDLIITSKSIVTESHEVSRLAKKLALECTDLRIRTNLLQACERIPTISGQLKMLTTVKGSSFGQQGSAEDQEAMDTLVGNAQNLMISVQDVVKGAISATVKISASQRGLRMKWVRKNYY